MSYSIFVPSKISWGAYKRASAEHELARQAVVAEHQPRWSAGKEDTAEDDRYRTQLAEIDERFFPEVDKMAWPRALGCCIPADWPQTGGSNFTTTAMLQVMLGLTEAEHAVRYLEPGPRMQQAIQHMLTVTIQKWWSEADRTNDDDEELMRFHRLMHELASALWQATDQQTAIVW